MHATAIDLHGRQKTSGHPRSAALAAQFAERFANLGDKAKAADAERKALVDEAELAKAMKRMTDGMKGWDRGLGDAPKLPEPVGDHPGHDRLADAGVRAGDEQAGEGDGTQGRGLRGLPRAGPGGSGEGDRVRVGHGRL